MIQKRVHIAALLLAALLFLLLYGYKIIDPSHIEWEMTGDNCFNFLGWHFFRTEAWHFPLGVINKYHYPSGTGVVFTSSIPLLAIPLKLFNDFLPKTFQYIGLWLLASYMLQGFFASLLLKKFSNDWRLILLGTTFFILAPIMFFRAWGHEALTGQWLILAALYLYFSPATTPTRIKYMLLILIATMVHFYLLAMVLAIWIAYLLKESLLGANKKYSAIYFLLTMIIVVCNMWVSGYFTIPVASAATSGFGYYSMNLLAPFNPAGAGDTTFFNKIKLATNGQYEGYNYLGVGVLLLMVMSLFKLPKAIKKCKLKATLVPLSLVMLALFVYSLSGKVTLGSKVLFEFKYPWLLQDLANILRASGRMFWPVYYTLMLTAMFIIIKYYKPKIALAILLIALLLQVIDLYPWYRSRNLEHRTFVSSLKSKDWQKIASGVKHIVMIPPIVKSDGQYNFALYAANNHLDINTGFVAREDLAKRAKYQQKLLTDFANNKLQEKTLYIVNKHYMIFPTAKNNSKHLFGRLDNYYIIVPSNLKLKLGNWFRVNHYNISKNTL